MHLVILGNGAAAISAVRTVKRKNRKIKITLISKENVPYYSPAILPYYLEGKVRRQDLFPEKWDFYRKNKIEIIMGKKVKHINPQEKKVGLEDGFELEWDKLLIATGASPSIPSFKGIENKGVFVFRTLSDAESILNNLKKRW